ncbi:non-homologous end-joining DNA ligase [Haloactinomyces albus]|uniref:DNA ligase (ATP) n=1 Tax=Haloactinomyces albus TaxID=1352928 RepID=A0AAE3Z8B5_9ACTN|nr:non-homologous end-joining DNA ligase [Haloactinomyces albus]MDR7300212.1 DNA ligase D-like protein (predicted ligase) [Haloactinomyces albus]
MERDPQNVLSAEERSRLRRWNDGEWVEPMRATPTDTPFSDPGWLFEPKLDGVRVLVGRDDGGVPMLWSRNHKRVDDSYPEIVAAMAEQNADRFLVDGEVVAFEGKRTSFAKLQSRIHVASAEEARATGVAVHLYLFDMLALGGVDLRAVPLRTRKRLVEAVFSFHGPLHYGGHRNTEGEKFYRQACERGWEGILAKRADSGYESRRSREWLKFKCVSDQEFVIGGFTEPQGTRTGFGALLVGYYENRRLRYAGKVGTGYDQSTLRDLRNRLDELERDTRSFGERVGERGAHWVSPELVAQVAFTEWTRDGKLRHPRFIGLRQDKPARDVVREL